MNFLQKFPFSVELKISLRDLQRYLYFDQTIDCLFVVQFALEHFWEFFYLFVAPQKIWTSVFQNLNYNFAASVASRIDFKYTMKGVPPVPTSDKLWLRLLNELDLKCINVSPIFSSLHSPDFFWNLFFVFIFCFWIWIIVDKLLWLVFSFWLSFQKVFFFTARCKLLVKKCLLG